MKSGSIIALIILFFFNKVNAQQDSILEIRNSEVKYPNSDWVKDNADYITVVQIDSSTNYDLCNLCIFKNLHELRLLNSSFLELPTCISNNKQLRLLELRNITFNELKSLKVKYLSHLILSQLSGNFLNKKIKCGKLTGLVLEEMDIGAIPEFVFSLKDLKVLVLYYNPIVYVSDKICNLRNLKRFELAESQISFLPECMCSLPLFSQLELSNNYKLNLENILVILDKCSKLKDVNLSNTNIKVCNLPIDIRNKFGIECR